MNIEATLGDPTENGVYAARQWHSWRILQWHDGAWWHPGLSAKWPVGAPSHNETGIEAHFGPLPTISQDFTKPAPRRGRDNRAPQTVAPEPEDWETRFPDAPSPAAMEFDL